MLRAVQLKERLLGRDSAIHPNEVNLGNAVQPIIELANGSFSRYLADRGYPILTLSKEEDLSVAGLSSMPASERAGWPDRMQLLAEIYLRLKARFPKEGRIGLRDMLRLKDRARFTTPLQRYSDFLHLRMADAAIDNLPLGNREILGMLEESGLDGGPPRSGKGRQAGRQALR